MPPSDSRVFVPEGEISAANYITRESLCHSVSPYFNDGGGLSESPSCEFHAMLRVLNPIIE